MNQLVINTVIACKLYGENINNEYFKKKAEHTIEELNRELQRLEKMEARLKAEIDQTTKSSGHVYRFLEQTLKEILYEK
jgi:prefoldin subunit 5